MAPQPAGSLVTFVFEKYGMNRFVFIHQKFQCFANKHLRFQLNITLERETQAMEHLSSLQPRNEMKFKNISYYILMKNHFVERYNTEPALAKKKAGKDKINP